MRLALVRTALSRADARAAAAIAAAISAEPLRAEAPTVHVVRRLARIGRGLHLRHEQAEQPVAHGVDLSPHFLHHLPPHCGRSLRARDETALVSSTLRRRCT